MLQGFWTIFSLGAPDTFEIHNKAAWNSQNWFCLESDRYQHEIEAKCVGP